ncbi:MAG: hypothetical protein KKH68_04645 [Proteobacteria bacterium]|nr:hypothetical protein [Pseudomonadota bacterium]
MGKTKFSSTLKPWVISLLLLSPAAGLYISHFSFGAVDPNKPATGFIQYDMAYYMANAREHSDSGDFTLTYGNPFSAFSQTPKIYFQPLILILGVIWFITKADPGLIFVTFGFFAAFFCVRVSLTLYRELFGLDSTSKIIGLICFVWGGGILCVLGGSYGVITGKGIQTLFRFDPFDGWWFLNYGRNLIYPTEAFYHLIVFGGVLFLFKRRFAWAFAMFLCLSMSHPFTGLQFILVVLTWSCLERFYFKSGYITANVVCLSGILLLAHLSYYLLFLPVSQEHASVMSQWSLPWTLRVENMNGAYLLVGGLALWRIRRPCLAAEVFSSPQNRLLLVWFLVSLLLANHEFAFDPVQPLHFTRGYVWIPLFLLGAPSLISLLDYLTSNLKSDHARYATILILLFFNADNAIWFTFQVHKPTGIYLRPDSQELLTWLRRWPRLEQESVLISNDAEFSYMAMVYTPMRSWYSHWSCTPFAKDRAGDIELFFKDGREFPLWAYGDLVIVKKRMPEKPTRSPPPRAELSDDAFENGDFRVFMTPARRQMKQP